MSGELQTIPARHGVATFVPRGRTIKVINTYGKQVVSMWAFSLGPPPEDVEDGEGENLDEEDIQKEADELKQVVEEGNGENAGPRENDAEASQKEGKEEKEEDDGKGKETESTSKETETTEDNDDPPEQAPDTPEGEKSSEKTTENTDSSSKQPSKRTWGSYLPSIPYRNKGTTSKAGAEPKPDTKEEKKQAEANTKTWSSYLPTGKGFSSYIPNVQLPDSKEAMSAFKSSHYRDPNKSYAEQLYDFSKTPVGAGSLAAATGSGYASAVYSAYSAYAATHPSSSQQPMEYLSLPHTRAASYKLVPEVNDELLTNLRNPIITLVEDTSPGAHDTLTAACDANLYNALGVDKPEEHGSCAENLVLALKELNEEAGLKGAKSIGADITVNIAPTPLHLFMNAPLQLENTAQSEGAGPKGAIIKVEEPKGKKRCFVRFKAERDIVVVFSACPMDIGSQNGGRCMAANFMVEDAQEGEDLASSVASVKKKAAPKKLGGEKKAAPKKDEASEGSGDKQASKEATQQDDAKLSEPAKPPRDPRRAPPRKLSATNTSKAADPIASKKEAPKKDESKNAEAIPEEEAKIEEPKIEEPVAEDAKTEDAKPKKKPKKLQVRGASASTGSSTPGKSA